jgi:hypothetical protein
MKKLFVVFGCALLFVGCASDDPFAPLPQEPHETLVGEILPFDLSVSTLATHRLERDEKLVVLLASDIVPLSEFEGQEASVTGVRRTEKMREIFIVDELHLLADELRGDDQESFPERFATKNFSFVFPRNWQYSTAPDGTMHFTEKTDAQGRVFLQFTVEPKERRDEKMTPSVSIAGFKGTKSVMGDELGREQQKIVLWSNNSNKKYTFSFTADFEEFEKKKAFYELLNSFVEGEIAVRAAQDEDLRIQAEREAAKVRELTKPKTPEIDSEADEAPTEEVAGEEKEGVFSRLFGSKEKVDTEGALQKAADSAADMPLRDDFTNLIDGKAFPYTSDYLKFSMKAPWGYWFQNVGPTEPLLLQFGFAKHEITGIADSDFLLEIVPSENPVVTARERKADGELFIEWARDDNSFFRLHGPESARDAMRSVQTTVSGF